MAPFVGQELPKASISGIERSFDGERRRFFDAQELVAFSLAFDLPIVWFFLPPPWMGDLTLAATDEAVLSLMRLLYGRDNQQEQLQARIAELREVDPRAAGELVAEAGGFPPEVSWEHFQRSREEALFALVEEETTQIERLVGDLRRVLDRFDDLSMRTHYDTHPRAVFRSISHSIIGERVFRKVMFTHDPADDERYTNLRMHIASPDAVERVIDLDDPETVARLAAVYDRAEELLEAKATERARNKGKGS